MAAATLMLAPMLMLALVGPAAPVAAQDEPSRAAQQARAQLEAATRALQTADSARDRVRALTETVRAYEAGLSAMREGLRRAATREAQIARQVEAREDEIAGLLGVLTTIAASPPPVLMVHPSGPMGAARSAMMLAEVTPGLNAQAAALRRDLDDIRTLRALQENAAETLRDGLAGIQEARVALSQAIADRTDLPRRFTEDPVRTAILISSVETLDGFASGLSQMSDERIVPSSADITGLRGALPLPVQGIVLRRAGEPDAAGIRRAGIVVATRPRALVTTPTAATIRYRGPLLDLGTVVILEPQAETLFILSGLREVFGETGEVIPEGSPVGIMGGTELDVGAEGSLSGDRGGAVRSETLYIEVREGDTAVDPETWFQTHKDG